MSEHETTASSEVTPEKRAWTTPAIDELEVVAATMVAVGGAYIDDFTSYQS